MPILGEIHAEPILSKGTVFEAMGYEVFSDEVKRFHESEAFIRIPTAPARSSKSYSASPEVVYRALPHRPMLGSLQWIVGVDYPTNKEFQYVWKWLVEERDRWTMNGQKMSIEKAHNSPQNGNMIIVIDWGMGPHGRAKAIIEGKSSTNEKSLQGEHVTQAVLSEAAEHPSYIWQKYLSTRSTWSLFPTTPKPKADWLREMGEAGDKDPSLSIESFIFPPQSNPYYDMDRFERESKRAASRSPTGKAEDDPYFAEQFLGRWVYYTGRVLPLADANFVTLNPAWLDVAKLYVSCDYGYEDACVALFWAVLPSGALLLWDEIYERHMTTPDYVEQISEKLAGRERQLGYVCGDPKQPQVARYLSDFGMNVIDVNKRAQSDRAVGHRRLVDLVSDHPELGHPMLFVDAGRCPRTTAEWKHLRFKEGMRNEYGSTALEGEDHAFDAARYFVTTRPDPQRVEQRPDWMRELALRARSNARVTGCRFSATQGLARRVHAQRPTYGTAA